MSQEEEKEELLFEIEDKNERIAFLREEISMLKKDLKNARVKIALLEEEIDKHKCPEECGCHMDM